MPRYFLLYLVAFWVPNLALTPLVLRFARGGTRKAFWLNLLLFCWPAAIAMEYLYLKFDVWTFSEAWDPLLGWRVFGAPVEEFVFWFGAPWIIMLMYVAFDMLDKRYLRTARA
jgi:uncharacterized membrane protein YqaE (UPF0057 family)